MAIDRRRNDADRVAMLERMWADGASTRDIAVAMGWKPDKANRYISVYRHRGYNLPRRYSDARVAAQRAGRAAV